MQTGADHIVVRTTTAGCPRPRGDARQRPAGVPDSTTILPIGDLEDAGRPGAEPGRREPDDSLASRPTSPGAPAGSTTRARRAVVPGGRAARCGPGSGSAALADGSRAGERLRPDRHARRAADLRGDRHRGDHPVASHRGRLVGDDPAAPQRRGSGGVLRPVARLFAEGGRGAGLDRRPDRASRIGRYFDEFCGPARTAAARRRRRSAC
jgi:hypothetical protein